MTSFVMFPSCYRENTLSPKTCDMLGVRNHQETPRRIRVGYIGEESRMREEAAYRSLRVEHGEHGVAEIVLFGPGKGNAMGPDFWRELPLATAALEANDGIHVVIVRGD